MEKVKLNVETYVFRDGDVKFYVDITEMDNVYDVWLYEQECGIKWHIFGFEKRPGSMKFLMDKLNETIGYYIHIYKEDYMN